MKIELTKVEFTPELPFNECTKKQVINLITSQLQVEGKLYDGAKVIFNLEEIVYLGSRNRE